MFRASIGITVKIRFAAAAAALGGTCSFFLWSTFYSGWRIALNCNRRRFRTLHKDFFCEFVPIGGDRHRPGAQTSQSWLSPECKATDRATHAGKLNRAARTAGDGD
jgi:hypothetical protein